jgi:quercetin dioxygenase-like cupin family protein
MEKEIDKAIEAQKANPDDLMDYQTSSVVSRTLVKQDKGSVTLFAFDKGQALSEHTAPFDALINIIDGKAEIIIDGKDTSMEKGELILMPANVPHAVNATEKFKMILTMIKS